MIYRCILPDWANQEDKPKVLEGEFSEDQLKDFNSEGYNVYFLPNYPSKYENGRPVDGRDIDQFKYVFVDFDLKSGTYESKDAFIDKILEFSLPPSMIVDSGGGIHVYWAISDLDVMNYLRFQRRLTRQFNTDEAVSKIYQLMRVPGTYNTKLQDNFRLCDVVGSVDHSYTSEQLDIALSPITPKDEEYCRQHYDRTYRVNTGNKKVDDTIPLKFAELLRNNKEVKSIWSGGLDDRSSGDYRLGHIMFASGFSKDEATSVLVNCPKALSRSPEHRIGYAVNIIDKIWVYEEDKSSSLAKSVRDILNKPTESSKDARFPCYKWVDNTAYGFRLGHVMGLVAGSGVGKTVIALNLFLGFVESNPEYDHFFVSLEQPKEEIANRWKQVCGDNSSLYDRVFILDNYDEAGNFRHLSLSQIEEYLVEFQKKSGRKIGCCVIDHIGILKKQTKDGENQGIVEICHQMKSFAIRTGTFLIMQSQSSREKAGIGDLEIGKDAAYGTVFFESYCDYLMCLWQPLKRCYSESGCPTVTAFKFGKIRHKNQHLDVIKEDVCYKLYFEPTSGKLRGLTEDEEKSFKFFLNKATNKRKQDRKTDLVEYVSVKEVK